MAERTSRERNSWRAYNAAGDVQLVESGSGGEELGTKDKKSLIKEFVHSKKENFFGILNPTQRIIFLLLFTVWCAANAVNFVYMNLRITNVAQNTKVLQTEPKVTEVYLKKEDEKDPHSKFLKFRKPMPRVAVVVCSQMAFPGRLTFDSATTTVTTQNFGNLNSTTGEPAVCRTFTKPSRFNDYGAYANKATPCCGMEIPRSMLLRQQKAKPTDSDMDATVLRPLDPRAMAQLRVSSNASGFMGAFAVIIPEDGSKTLNDLLDPAGFEKVGVMAMFNDAKICEPNKTTTVAEGKVRDAYSSIKLRLEEDRRGIIPFLAKKMSDVTATLDVLQSRTNVFPKTVKCSAPDRDNYIKGQSHFLGWNFIFYANFQQELMTRVEKRNNQELTDGLGSFFGLMMSSMAIWSFFFPAKPELDPGVRKPHTCFYFICPSWKKEKEENLEQDPDKI
jgi:hypothetical protein